MAITAPHLRYYDHGLCRRTVRPCEPCSTQLPYAITCAAVSGVTYLIVGLLVHFGLPE